MKKKFKNIMLGIRDGVFPSLSKSVEKKPPGQKNEINTARLIAALISWLVMVASLAGIIPWEKAVDLLKIIIISI